MGNTEHIAKPQLDRDQGKVPIVPSIQENDDDSVMAKDIGPKPPDTEAWNKSKELERVNHGNAQSHGEKDSVSEQSFVKDSSAAASPSISDDKNISDLFAPGYISGEENQTNKGKSKSKQKSTKRAPSGPLGVKTGGRTGELSHK